MQTTRPVECRSHIRYSLSDEDGVLRFQAFDIANGLDCGEAVNALREYLLGRPLTDVNVDRLSALVSDERCTCMDEVIKTVQECQDLFVRSRKDR